MVIEREKREKREREKREEREREIVREIWCTLWCK